jgi:hypothetical protein
MITGVERGHIGENLMLILKKIFFSRTSTPISVKLGAYHSWVKGIFICTNKGPGPLHRGDNHKNAKIW